MNTFWTTLIEINLILSIVYLGYVLFLKNLTFFRWTRFYLLGGMLTGLIYPFLKTQKVVITPAESVNIVIPNIATVSSQTQSIDYGQWAIYAYFVLFAALLIRFGLRFFSLGKIHSDSSESEFNGLAYRNTNARINPFSFWKWIYIHRPNHSEKEMNQIVKHEYIHTSQRHSFDVILVEICSMVCWYNPLIKLLNKSVKDNLEYLVDAEVLNSGTDKISYQHSLVGVSMNGFPSIYPGNQFAFKTLKRRIKMMNQTKSSRYRLLSFMILTPLVLAAASLLTFSCQKETLDTLKNAEKGEGISLIGKGKVEIGELKIGDGIMTEDSLKNILKSKVTSEIIVEEGKTLATFASDDNSNNEEFSKITTTSNSFEEGVKEFHSRLNSIQIAENKDFVPVKPISKVIIRGAPFDSNTPLYILDGKEILHLENIKPDEIESISILKDKSAIVLYGDKAKNGVILITTKLGSRR
jgi:TonB-dependent SusC/RagA subfamily outer membrane receptor